MNISEFYAANSLANQNSIYKFKTHRERAKLHALTNQNQLILFFFHDLASYNPITSRGRPIPMQLNRGGELIFRQNYTEVIVSDFTAESHQHKFFNTR